MSTPATLTLPAPAKLNLFLHITGRRNDGYHELQTLFQFLDYSDSLTFTARDDGEVSLSGMGELPAADNLITRAAHRLQQSGAPGGQSHPGADIRIEKHLPSGGGLGGGSSNAATTLVALNRLWGLNLSRTQLADIGLSLGADVPVFIHGHAAWAEGIGEQLTSVEPAEPWYLVLHPDCEISTGEVFGHSDLTRNTPKRRIRTAFEGSGSGFRNDCEAVVRLLYPEVDKALAWLQHYGEARLTGTGACVFCPFETQSAAITAYEEKPSGINGFIARGRNRSPLYTQLGELD
ncbi:4-diphosphocytidyl-2-C-methyl-D-erythritol kinase [Halospina denitrificans]|uniref:4-diphosphocytidyl-2-C-methyl-D-erythritol kinase n=1 Tax=Halospina denitrificans TaxID=332522 RepID=A0A4R7JKE8_9GAMM|nr:4-(cytidine 5'-diphospho)-2-C-methyl-D-erythritol kinase [Halospina denitrificans]TDT38452.1 4-diphosphocytidyl-2-C-methyl-D-erythritol kinase [Halospina denitrificans]